MVDTNAGTPINSNILRNYFRSLVNSFFKILPIKEQNDEYEESLVVYMTSLQSELLGCKELITAIQYDSQFLTLLSILQYLIDNPECTAREVKREVFRAISICNKLEARYLEGGDLK